MDAAFCFSLLKSHEEVNHYATNSLEHFNYFLQRRLPRMIRDHCACTVVVPLPESTSQRKHVVSFSNMAIERPTVPKTDGVTRGIRVMQLDGDPLFPHEALLRGLTYSSGIFVDIKHEVFDDDVLRDSFLFRNVFLFQMPIAVGSIACNLVTSSGSIDAHALPRVARVDPEDRGGYFIVRGMTKVIQPQKTQRNNILLIRYITRGSDGWLEGNIRSIRADDKFRSTSTLRVYIVASGLMTVDIPYLKPNISIIGAFRVLGVSKRDAIEALIFDNGNCTDAPDLFKLRTEAARRLFSTSFTSAAATCTDDELVRLLGEPISDDSLDSTKIRRQVQQQITGELLPHCGYDDSPETRQRKLFYLGMLCRRMLWIQLGFEKEDDRDFEGFKSLQMSSTTLSMLVRQLMGTFSKNLRKRIFDRAKDGKHIDVASLILHMDTMPGLAKAFTDGEVTVQKEASNAGTEVIQLVQQVNPLSLQSHICRVNTPLPKSGKYTQCRSIDPSSLFSVCPIKTPEGEGAGLLQTLTIFSLVRVSIDMDGLAVILRNMPHVLPMEGAGLFVWLNSDPIGRTDDPETLLNSIREGRRNGLLPPSITTVFTGWGLLVTSDIGVITFPLMHAPSLHKLPAAIKECEFGGTNLWRTLMNHGIIEYVDAWEALDYTVSFKSPPPPNATHVAPHPTCFISTAAGTIPFANHNQAPRNSYQSGMAEQAISAPCLTAFDRHEMNYRHILWYPQTPVCTTQISEVKQLNSWPMGTNAIVAIAPAFTSEDCITFSKSAEEFGMMRITVMRSYRAVAKKMGTDLETFEHPHSGTPKCIGMRGECDYSKIGSDGLPIPGTWVKSGDVIIGRTGKVHEVGADGEINDVRRDRSVVLHCDESEVQVIDTVLVSETKDGHRMVRVTTRSTRRLQCGDKLSSRHGQKGTVGTMMAAEDMPFVAAGPNAGMRPDIIINLQCINGRMTIGKLLEVLYASLGVVKGEIQDATPFFNVSAKWALEELAKAGYSDQHTMISGTTGEVFDQPWFLGPCFYQRLKHHVLDKIVARARGVCAVLTRQPVDGRANNGGQQFGEMEFDAQKANGAAYALYDRSVTASDKFRTMICQKCGTMGEVITPTLGALSKGSGYMCRACSGSQVSEIDTTYCYSSLLVKELAAMNIRVQHHIPTGRLEILEHAIKE